MESGILFGEVHIGLKKHSQSILKYLLLLELWRAEQHLLFQVFSLTQKIFLFPLYESVTPSVWLYPAWVSLLVLIRAWTGPFQSWSRSGVDSCNPEGEQPHTPSQQAIAVA